MRIITALSARLDGYSETTGRLLAWLLPLLMLNTCAVVFLRYGLEQGSTFMQELSIYLHATVFMLGAGYTLKRDAHVRVDIFYRQFSLRAKAWVNALGTLVFLFPLCGYVILISWDFVSHAWMIRESSGEPGGIPAVFLLKTLIPLMAVNLAVQGLSDLLRSVAVLADSERAA
ncbi:MAG TPA: C4-dicarboxylate ABC transporter permease [Spongiibacteraceae bacterium]|nr:C4-dicarboxylate ABC transporter permease [Spongiibacteraceae bacterium]HCS28642.1 C4-dicarboxylate ABC transporter permease [Spongiibacteraceae bacterium]|tara:strand:- start:934 stop:1452 length:519 start_codon:yes stop_codon:yes gene_type:complete